MGNIVELGDDSVEKLWPCESILDLHLGSKVSQDDNGRLILSNQERSNQQLEM